MNLATLAHAHLLLNHFPTIGFGVGICLLLAAIAGKSEDLKRASLVVFSAIALLAIPTYLTGKAAQQAIAGGPGVSDALMETHQDAALLAFLVMEMVGFVAWLGLWHFRRTARPSRGNVSAVLVLSLVTFVLMARAAVIGGEIRHPEITTEGTVRADAEWLKTASIASFVNTTSWAWPATETLHFIGLCLLLGVALVVSLRMLGVMKNVSFAALHRLLPWGILGFGINLLTGIIFFITVPEQYTQNVALHWKMGLVLLAAVNVFYFTVFEEAWAVRSGVDAPLTAKVVAVSTIALWIGVIYFGRMMPFIGGSF